MESLTISSLRTSACQMDASAAAYFHRDEPEFNLLASFFGLYDVKVEFSQEVITISDNSTKVIVLSDSDVPDAPIRGQQMYSPSDSDEVTSPISAPATFVRQKLFDVEVPSFSALCNSSSPNRFNTGKSVNFSSTKGESSASWSPSPK